MARECAMQEATGTGRWARRAPVSEPIQAGPWDAHAATLPVQIREVVNRAVEVAAAHAWDVHVTQVRGDRIGIEFKPGAGPHVRIWEWPR